MKEIKLVMEVMVIETAASEYVCPSLSTTLTLEFVRRHAAKSTKASSIPTPNKQQEIKS